MSFVYILQSKKDPDRFYVGKTKNLKRRIQEHNRGNQTSTKNHAPWDIRTYTWFNDERRAVDFERYLKSSVGRRFQKRRF